MSSGDSPKSPLPSLNPRAIVIVICLAPPVRIVSLVVIELNVIEGSTGKTGSFQHEVNKTKSGRKLYFSNICFIGERYGLTLHHKRSKDAIVILLF